MELWYLCFQTGTVKAGEIFSYTIPDSYRMSDIHSTTVIERKSQTIYASDEIVVYASNKQVTRTHIYVYLYTEVMIETVFNN